MRNHPGLYRIGNGHAPPLIPSPPKSEKPGTLRLTELIPPFLDMVDGGRLAFNPAVELSYLSLENQTILFSIMERDELSPSLAQAQNLHKLSSLGKLDESAIEAILLTEPVLKKKVTLKVERIAPYFPRGTNPEEMEAVILRLFASWQRSREQKRAHKTRNVDILRTVLPLRESSVFRSAYFPETAHWAISSKTLDLQGFAPPTCCLPELLHRFRGV